MHLFISAGEPSGDLHGSNLARAVRAALPQARLVGFGGDKMATAGVDLLYPLTQLSIMWFSRSILNLPKFFRLADQAEQYFRREKPDAVVLIDYPGFHWHIARRARDRGIPVYYFVPPQIWAWGDWRRRKMRRDFDTVLSALPFEDAWFRGHGIRTYYVGHPYFDELARYQPDAAWIERQRQAGTAVVALLPGSRNQEVAANVPLMRAAAEQIYAQQPQTRFLVASFNDRQAATARQLLGGIRLPIEIHVGRTREIIALADAAIAVSGSVGLELMYHLVPSVIVYRYSRLARVVSKQFMTSQTISLVNLLAAEHIYPEFLTYRDDAAPLAAPVLRWLTDPAAKAATVAKLAALKAQVARPGACQRAAEFLLARHARPRPAAVGRAA